MNNGNGDPAPSHRNGLRPEILLPQFSGTGHYAVAILKSRTDESALMKGSGVATGNDIQAEVRVSIDLSHVAPGDYLLATWRGADRAQYYYPLQIVE